MGFAPVNNPAVTILAVLDSPVGQHHGGVVSGPIFKRVAEQVLAYLGVAHDVPLPSDVETAKNEGRKRGAAAKLQDAKADDSTRQSFAASIGKTRRVEAAPAASLRGAGFDRRSQPCRPECARRHRGMLEIRISAGADRQRRSC